MSDFHRLLLGLHAAARRIDRDHAMLGALGVGAMAYPHQMDSVHRMLTGTGCRWLLADEVGLGKTIQAIMVMRALAAQSLKPLNVLLVVPDDLAGQWAEEFLCRGHVLPIQSGEDGGATGNLNLRIARPSTLLTGNRLPAETVDLLIVDEFTKLQAQLRRDLLLAARVIPNVIVLTATPALHLPATRRELMGLMEPEAYAVAQAEDRDILHVLAEREAGALERFAPDLQESAKRRAVEDSYGLYRHLIRTARTDYPEALPKRNYQPMRLAPTDGDVGRAQTTRGYLEAARTSNLDIRSDLLLQVCGRSPVSLRERLSTLRRTSPALQAAWQRIDGCLRQEPGDAKLDALIDHLRGVFGRTKDARVVVVAEDNPTTDYLRNAIEKLADVKVAKKRRSVGAAADLGDQIASLKDALDDFISGEANVLVASDAAREGHNLQFANEIVFFALPWSPPDIQQWIGRIDRLGTKGLPGNRRIAITPIVIEGSIEERILEVLEGTGVFLKSEVFDEAEWDAISSSICAAAEGTGAGTWIDAAREAKILGDGYDAWLQATLLPPSSRTAIATRREHHLRNRPYAAPMTPVKDYPWNWHRMREIAAETMIRIAREDYLDVRTDRTGEQSFRTMWYKPRATSEGFVIPDLDTRNSWYRQAYIVRRGAIECPPRTHVVQDDGVKRRLHFFDHGGTLHDGTVAALELQIPSADIHTEFVVEYPIGHAALEWVDRRILVATAEVDFGDAIVFDHQILSDARIDQRMSKPEQDAWSGAERSALAQFQADRRWLIDLAPPEMLFAVLVESGEELLDADPAATAIMDPFLGKKCARQLGKRRPPFAESKILTAKARADDRLKRLARESLERSVGAVRAAADRRLFAAEADSENLTRAVRAQLTATEALDARLEFNKATQRAAALSLQLAEANWERRKARLSGVERGIRRTTRIVNKKMFWVIPRSPSEQQT